MPECYELRLAPQVRGLGLCGSCFHSTVLFDSVLRRLLAISKDLHAFPDLPTSLN